MKALYYQASDEADVPLEGKSNNSTWVCVRAANSGFGPNAMLSDTPFETFTLRSAAFRRLMTSRETITGVNLLDGAGLGIDVVGGYVSVNTYGLIPLTVGTSGM